MRVTNAMLMHAAMNDLGNLREKMAHAQDLVNGKALERPSEDPQAVVEAMDLTEMKDRLTQAQKSGDDANEWLKASESSLSSMIDELQSAHETMVQAGSPANLEQGGLQSLAKNLLSIRDALLREMNNQHRGQYLFAGWRTNVQPFDYTQGDPNGGVTYLANSDGVISRDIAPGLSVVTNTTGTQLMAGGDFMAILKQAADDLTNGNTQSVISTRLTDLDTALNHIIDLRSDAGVQQAQIDQYSQFADENLVTIEDRLTKLTGGDIEKSVMQMADAQNAYTAALASFSKNLPNSLLDYLR